MLFIKEHLHMLEERLYGEVFEKLWKRFAIVIDKVLFEEVTTLIISISHLQRSYRKLVSIKELTLSEYIDPLNHHGFCLPNHIEIFRFSC